jgi:hypothetical protein
MRKNQSDRNDWLGRRRVQRAIVVNTNRIVASGVHLEKRQLAVHRILRRADCSKATPSPSATAPAPAARGLHEHKEGDERRKMRALTSAGRLDPPPPLGFQAPNLGFNLACGQAR